MVLKSQVLQEEQINLYLSPLSGDVETDIQYFIQENARNVSFPPGWL